MKCEIQKNAGLRWKRREEPKNWECGQHSSQSCCGCGVEAIGRTTERWQHSLRRELCPKKCVNGLKRLSDRESTTTGLCLSAHTYLAICVYELGITSVWPDVRHIGHNYTTLLIITLLTCCVSNQINDCNSIKSVNYYSLYNTNNSWIKFNFNSQLNWLPLELSRLLRR